MVGNTVNYHRGFCFVWFGGWEEGTKSKSRTGKTGVSQHCHITAKEKGRVFNKTKWGWWAHGAADKKIVLQRFISWDKKPYCFSKYSEGVVADPGRHITPWRKREGKDCNRQGGFFMRQWYAWLLWLSRHFNACGWIIGHSLIRNFISYWNHYSLKLILWKRFLLSSSPYFFLRLV